jgi:hypothetical protein
MAPRAPTVTLTGHAAAGAMLIAGLFSAWEDNGGRTSFELFAVVDRLELARGAGLLAGLLVAVPVSVAGGGIAACFGWRRTYTASALYAAAVSAASAAVVWAAPAAYGSGVLITAFAAASMACFTAWPWRSRRSPGGDGRPGPSGQLTNGCGGDVVAGRSGQWQ